MGSTARRVPAGSQPVSGELKRDPSISRGESHIVSDADVYRNSTVDPASG